MRAVVFEGREDVAVRDVPDARVVDPTDAVVRVELAGLCGSDLHIYHGREEARPGVVMGHEAVGTVIDAGRESTIDPGTRVIVPFSTSCGRCVACRRGISARCERGRLFGFGDPNDPEGPALDGAQAELLRVPLADSTLVPLPPALPLVDGLLLADVVPTGWVAAERTRARPGDRVAVVGLGAVGCSAVAALAAMGITDIVGIDPVPSRRDRAAVLGAETADRAAASSFDAVIEAAGPPAAQRTAFDLLRPGGVLSVISVQTEERFAFTPVEAYDANVTVAMGRASVRSVLARLLPLVSNGTFSVPSETVVTHTDEPLDSAPELYRRFGDREDGMLKVVFTL